MYPINNGSQKIHLIGRKALGLLLEQRCILVDSKVDYGKNRNQALTAVIFVTGLSGIKVNFGNVQLTGMVLACVVGMILSLIFYIFDKMKLTNDQ